MNELENEVLNEKSSEKSTEQIQAEAHLDAAMPDLEKSAQADPPLSKNATDNLFGLLCLVPIGLQFSGLKNTAEVWNERNCRGLSEACIPVLRKYAWGAKIINFLETGAGIEEMALAAVCMPLALATHAAYKIDTVKQVQEDENSSVIKPNAARFGGGIEQANADDIAYAANN